MFLHCFGTSPVINCFKWGYHSINKVGTDLSMVFRIRTVRVEQPLDH